MNGSLSQISPGNFCAMVATAPGQWYILTVPEACNASAIAADIAEEIGLSLTEGQTFLLQIDGSVEALVRNVADTIAPVVVLSGFERLSTKDWASLNFLRSRLLGDRALVFVLDRRSLLLLQREAPDLYHLMNGSVWQLDQQADTLSEEDRAQRLAALRAWSGLTDADVLHRAEVRDLPADPEYAEWLVLLGKGDLLVR